MCPTCVSIASDFLDLKGICQKHIDGLWIPEHLDDEQAVQFAMDHFRRTLDAALELLEVKVD